MVEKRSYTLITPCTLVPSQPKSSYMSPRAWLKKRVKAVLLFPEKSEGMVCVGGVEGVSAFELAPRPVLAQVGAGSRHAPRATLLRTNDSENVVVHNGVQRH